MHVYIYTGTYVHRLYTPTPTWHRHLACNLPAVRCPSCRSLNSDEPQVSCDLTHPDSPAPRPVRQPHPKLPAPLPSVKGQEPVCAKMDGCTPGGGRADNLTVGRTICMHRRVLLKRSSEKLELPEATLGSSCCASSVNNQRQEKQTVGAGTGRWGPLGPRWN